MEKITQAKALLATGEYTLAVCGDGVQYTSTRRGVAPMVEFLDHNLPLSGCAAADKVVGKATALLFVLAGITAVHAGVLSRPAQAVLEQHGIAVTCDRLVERIENRDKTGLCPMEQAVWEMDDPVQALHAVRAKMEELQQKKE